MIAALLRKDLRKIWPLAAAFAVFSVLICAVMFQEDYILNSAYGSGSALILSGMMLYMLIFGGLMNIEKYEEKHNGYKIMSALPLPNFILSGVKFTILIFCFIIGVPYLLIILKIFAVMEGSFMLKLKYFLLSGSIGLAVNSVGYVGILKYGYNKIRVRITIVYIGLLLTPQVLHFLLLIFGNDTGFIQIIDRLPGFGIGIIVTVCFGLYLFSWYISTRIRRVEL